MDDTALLVEINALMVRGQIAWKRGASIISVILPVEESNTALWLVDLISCPNYTMSRLRVILGTTDFGRAKLAQEKPVSGSWASCRMRGCWSVQNSTHRAVLKPLSSLAWPTLARQLVGGASGPLASSRLAFVVIFINISCSAMTFWTICYQEGTQTLTRPSRKRA